MTAMFAPGYYKTNRRAFVGLQVHAWHPARLCPALEIMEGLWEPPHVKLRTDNRARLYGRDVLKPNTDYQAEMEGNRIVLVKMVPAEPKIVRPRRVNGRLRPPAGFRPSRETIAVAIRSDRDEQ